MSTENSGTDWTWLVLLALLLVYELHEKGELHGCGVHVHVDQAPSASATGAP